MRLSTLTQRSELKAAEERHDLAGAIAVAALVLALLLVFAGHWPVALGVAAAGAFVFLGTALEVRKVGDPRSAEEFYRLADPRTPLGQPRGAAPAVSGDPAGASGQPHPGVAGGAGMVKVGSARISP